jgi:prepilin-type N-terminal cleavage/methylation domain-containing protein
MNASRERPAFSLLELLAVVLIIGVIAAVVIGRISTTGATAKENACNRNKAEINRVIERYHFDNAAWPADLSDIASLPDFPDGIPVCPVSGAPYAIDPVTHRVQGHTTGSH